MSENKVVVYLDEATSLKWDQNVDCRYPNVAIVAVVNGKAYTANSFPYPRTIKFNSDFFYGLPKPGFFSRGKPIPVKLYYFPTISKEFNLEYVSAKDRKTNKTLAHLCIIGVKLSISANDYINFEKFMNNMKMPIKPGVLFTQDDLETVVSSLSGYVAGDLISAGFLSSSDFDSRGFCTINSKKELMKIPYTTASRLNKFRDELLARMESALSNMGFYLSTTVN